MPTCVAANPSTAASTASRISAKSVCTGPVIRNQQRSDPCRCSDRAFLERLQVHRVLQSRERNETVKRLMRDAQTLHSAGRCMRGWPVASAHVKVEMRGLGSCGEKEPSAVVLVLLYATVSVTVGALPCSGRLTTAGQQPDCGRAAQARWGAAGNRQGHRVPGLRSGVVPDGSDRFRRRRQIRSVTGDQISPRLGRKKVAGEARRSSDASRFSPPQAEGDMGTCPAQPFRVGDRSA
jgi:hypothetical protein